MLTGISVIDVAAIFWITLATLASVTAKNWMPRRSFPRVLPWLTGLLLVVTVVYSATRFVADNRYMLAREIVHGMVAGSPTDATEAALRFAPYELTYRRHVVQLIQGTDPQQAKIAALAALSIEPDDKDTLFMLTETYLQLGQEDEAVRVLQRIEGLAPNDPMVDSLRKIAEQGPAATP